MGRVQFDGRRYRTMTVRGTRAEAEKTRRALDAATEGGGLTVAESETLIAPSVVAFPGV